MTSNSPCPTSLKLSVKAGLALGTLRGFWIMVEHLAGIRTDHLESVELSYGIFLSLGTLFVWWRFLHVDSQDPHLTSRDLLIGGVGAGLFSGAIHVLTFYAYTRWINPEYLDAFIAWNVDHSSNTFEIANREFRLPAFLDILLVHPVIFNPIAASLVNLVLTKLSPTSQN